MKEAIKLIPKQFRKRGLYVVILGFARALLNFLGIAALLPVLYVVIEPKKMLQNNLVAKFYNYFGFASPQSFIVCICIAVIAIIVVKSVLNIVLYRIQTNYFLLLFRYFSKRLFCAYHWRGLVFLKKNNSARLAHEVNFICMAYVFNVAAQYSGIIIETVFAIMMFATMVYINASAALLIAAVFVPIIILQSWFMRRNIKAYGKKENEARWKQQRLVLESFRGYADIEINNTLSIIAKRFEDGQKTISKYRRKMELISQIPAGITEISVIIAMVILVLTKANIVVFGVFAIMSLRMLPAVRNVMNCIITIKNNNYTIETIANGNAYFDKINAGENNDRIAFENKIEIQNLTFKFDDGNEFVINNFSISIQKGKRIGIQGASGAGKTTLFNILLGFYPPTSGKILIDGVELNEKTKKSWQNIVGYVPQEVFIMDTTISENISLGKDFDKEKMQKVIDMASLSKFVETLPNGIDTTIGECGNRLSGGQKQRIAIARALYKNAEVLLFDEATSSLDKETEREISESIKQLSDKNKELTFIIISHNDNSLMFCDRIIELK